jgi:hypothetical protein
MMRPNVLGVAVALKCVCILLPMNGRAARHEQTGIEKIVV